MSTMAEADRCTTRAGIRYRALRCAGHEVPIGEHAIESMASIIEELAKAMHKAKDLHGWTAFMHAEGCDGEGCSDEYNITPAIVIYGPDDEFVVIDYTSANPRYSEWYITRERLQRSGRKTS